MSNEADTFTPARLKAWRRDKGFTQAEAAKLVGVNRTSLALWETGRARPTKHMAVLEDLLAGHEGRSGAAVATISTAPRSELKGEKRNILLGAEQCPRPHPTMAGATTGWVRLTARFEMREPVALANTDAAPPP